MTCFYGTNKYFENRWKAWHYFDINEDLILRTKLIIVKLDLECLIELRLEVYYSKFIYTIEPRKNLTSCIFWSIRANIFFKQLIRLLNF